MFCLYCGTNLPDDAIFCNRCGKQQKVAENESATDIAILPFPTLPEASTGGGQATVGNVPMVQGTPSTSDSSSAQSFAHSAPNAASPVSSPSVPSQLPSSASLASTQHPEHQAYSYEPQRHNQTLSHTFPSHPMPTMHSHSESPASSVHEPHTVGRRVSPHGLNLAGRFSRRAVIVGLVGATVTVAGGAITWVVLTQRHQASPLSSGPSANRTPIPLGTTLVICRGHSASVNDIGWSPDGKHLASASDDKTVQVWDSATGKSVIVYQGHTGKVHALAWSPDGKHIASASDDNSDATVQIWEAATGKNVLTYRGHRYGVVDVSWSQMVEELFQEVLMRQHKYGMQPQAKLYSLIAVIVIM